MFNSELQEHAIEYAKISGITIDLKTSLGYGTDGTVWRSNRKTAVKAIALSSN